LITLLLLASTHKLFAIQKVAKVHVSSAKVSKILKSIVNQDSTVTVQLVKRQVPLVKFLAQTFGVKVLDGVIQTLTLEQIL
jgi:hypothetical protein